MGYKKVINERQEEMGEDNNSFGGYQPTEDNGQVGQQNPYEGAPQYGQNDQNYGQPGGQYGQNYGQPGGQYDQNYGQPGGQYGQNYGQPGGDPYGQNYSNQDMNMGGGPAYPQNNMQPQESKGVSIASMVLGIFSLTFGCCITYVGIASAIAGIITGIISLKNKRPGKGMAIARYYNERNSICVPGVLYYPGSYIGHISGYGGRNTQTDTVRKLLKM